MAGKNKADRPYFEGWYFKCRTKDGKTIALIPTLHKDGIGQGRASFACTVGEPHHERRDASAMPERFFCIRNNAIKFTKAAA